MKNIKRTIETLLYFRWDALDNSIVEQLKKVETQHHQWSLYIDSLGLTRQWLEGIEQSLGGELVSNWLSGQEVRSRLVRHKATLQDIIAHRRSIETMKEKLATVEGLSESASENLKGQVENIADRYESVNGIVKVSN